MPEISVRDEPKRERYIAQVDGNLAGFTVYHVRRGNLYFFPHTEVFMDYAGQGVGKALVRSALDDVRDKGGKIVPLCPYVYEFTQKNPEYDALIDHEVFGRIAARLHGE